jgi:hypothetical protein
VNVGLPYGDHVIEQATVSGTGPVTCAGALLQGVPFSSLCNDGDYVTYCIIDKPSKDNWETGLSKYNAGPNTLTRDIPLSGKSAGVAVKNTLVPFSGGGQTVFCAPLAEERQGQPINVLLFGADETGTVDSSAAITLAQTVAGANGAIFLPAGTYLVGTAIQWIPGVSWLGAGASVTTILFTAAFGAGSNFSGIYLIQSVLTDASGRFTDITFDGQNIANRAMTLQGHVGGQSNFFTPVFNIVIERCTFQNFNQIVSGFLQPCLGISTCVGAKVQNCKFINSVCAMKVNQQVENFTVEQCTFYGFQGATAVVLWFTNGTFQCNVLNCNFYLNGTLATPISAIIQWDSPCFAAGLNARGNLFHSNYATYG